MGEKKILKKLNRNDIPGIAAAVPGLLLCAVTLMMLVLDILIPAMTDKQYQIYPASVRVCSLISIICMATCFSSELADNSIRIDLKDILFMLFTVCMFISTAVNGISHDAFFSVAYRYVGVFDLCVYIFVYMYCAGRMGTEKLKLSFLTAYMLTADLISTVFLFNCFSDSIAAFSGKEEPSAIFFHGNHYGYFLVMAVIISAGFLLFSGSRSMAAGEASLVINLAALAFNRSMGCLIAAGSVLLIMIAVSVIKGGMYRKKSLVMLISLMLLASAALIVIEPLRADVFQTIREAMKLVSGENDIYAGNGRWGIWQFVAGYVSDYPWWGYGCEGIADIMKEYTLTTSPHNEPLTYAAFFGIPAAVLYCLGVITAVIAGLRKGVEGGASFIAAFAALAYFISSLFGVAMFYTAPFMFMLLGLSADKRSIGSASESYRQSSI